MMPASSPERAALVASAGDTIALGSQSFSTASKLFSPKTREQAWLLYAWCRSLDDLTDGQELGHAVARTTNPAAVQAHLAMLTAVALDSDADVPPAFAALRQIRRETSMPRRFIEDHLAGFALDAEDWRPRDEDDMLRYCYHVAGSVGCMMAVVMGVDPADDDTLDRACDLGLAFQLANIARDIVPDAQVGRCYIPADWLSELRLTETAIADPANRRALAELARRLVTLAEPYRLSARIGAARLPGRSRLAVLAADAIYGAIGERVAALGAHAWDRRVSISKAGKAALFARALLRGFATPKPAPRGGLWTRPRQSS